MQRLIRGTIAAIVIAAMFIVPAMAAPAAQDVQALITSPTDGQAVSGLVPVFGTVTASDFSRYELAFGPDPNPGDSWTTFASPNIVLTNAQIGLWDANQPAGTYALRLRVFRSDGSVAAEDFVNGLIVGPPPTEAPAATPTSVPPAPTFETETQATTQPTVDIPQPPTATPTSVAAAGSVDEAGASRRDGGSSIDLSRFGAACVNGIWCAVGAYFLLGAFVFGRWGVRRLMKQLRERPEQ
jgi:cell division septation protein DedD